ncbi:glycosyl transferase family protein [Novosphingobium rosa]|uniref:glycosyl transferase family protein n=1 Tax=Novosphingobium rosa TaxID=76978 RepID=UPI001FDEC160|nr:glycosyl transferase family protein [Novosphingobium rosa]
MFDGVPAADSAIRFFHGFHWLQILERELLYFALFWFVIGMIDEMLIDILWFALRLRSGRFESPVLPATHALPVAPAPIAVFIAAWQEADVIGATIGHMLGVWARESMRIYVGCYCNDAPTIAAVMRAARGDPRIRIVINDHPGPTTKADCLNRLYAALVEDELRQGQRFLGVVLHDAEDMVHPRELSVIGEALASVDFVQLPVRPEMPPGPHWVGGHYADEFVESHTRVLTVRDALGAALPAAGVGCGFARAMLSRIGVLRREQGERGPFVAECFTEDYEIGMLVSHLGGKARFLRLRDETGELIATRSYFPDTVAGAVRQKTRWIHGIALQSWDRLGWMGRPVDVWMALRDRRGPLVALVLSVAYALLLLQAALAPLRAMHWIEGDPGLPLVHRLVWLSFLGLLWRMVMRFGFSAREYGAMEGLRAVGRIPVANIITIIAGRRALVAYCRTLRGKTVAWDKTPHLDHPVLAKKVMRPAMAPSPEGLPA